MVLIAGGGPAGMMLGYLLGRCGVEVTVFEKHADFLRDFRGDTVHPSTLEVMHELGLAERFLARPHDKIREIRGAIGGEPVTLADMRHLPVHHRFVALMPQWDFLDFLADEARRFPAFHLEMEAEAVGLVERDGRVAGLTVKRHGAAEERLADLVIAADGRHSAIRKAAGLESEEIGSPIDVLWLRLPKPDGAKTIPLGNVVAGRLFGRLTDDDLGAVQARREWPTRVTQRIQATIQDQIIRRILRSREPISGVPLPLKFFGWFPVLRRIPARFIGLGVRPEHISRDLPLTH